MALTSIYAKKQFEKIRQITASHGNELQKLINSDKTKGPSINFVFNGVVFQLSNSAPDSCKTRADRLQYVFDNSPSSPGPTLITETKALAKDLNDFFRNLRVPSDADLRLSVHRLANFIAFYANVQVPNDIQTFCSSQPQTKNAMTLSMNDLINNPTTRVPVVLCLDTSGSMLGKKITELNRGVQEFFQAIKNDDIAKYSVELCIVTFDSSVKKQLDFASIESQEQSFSKVNLSAFGQTCMGAAVNMALDLLETRKKEYQDNGVDYWQPWLVLMTDGQPTDDITSAVERIKNLVENKKLTIFPIGIGDGANMIRLAQFSPNRPPLRLKGLMISEFFNWLGKSVKTTSQSAPGTKINLPPIEWAIL